MTIDTLIELDDDDDSGFIPTNFVADADGHRVERRARKALNPTFDRPIVALEAPDPPRYFGGACRYKPMPGIDVVIARALARPDWNLCAICRTCQTILQEPFVFDAWTRTTLRIRPAHVIGAASDHDRINLNHDVVVIALPERSVIWKSDWHPFRTSDGVKRR